GCPPISRVLLLEVAEGIGLRSGTKMPVLRLGYNTNGLGYGEGAADGNFGAEPVVERYAFRHETDPKYRDRLPAHHLARRGNCSFLPRHPSRRFRLTTYPRKPRFSSAAARLPPHCLRRASSARVRLET